MAAISVIAGIAERSRTSAPPVCTTRQLAVKEGEALDHFLYFCEAMWGGRRTPWSGSSADGQKAVAGVRPRTRGSAPHEQPDLRYS